MSHRVALLVLLGLSTGAPAAETVRIAIGTYAGEVTLRAEALGYGPDADDAIYQGVNGPRLRVRNVRGQLTLNGTAWQGDRVRVRAAAAGWEAGRPGSGSIRAGDTEVRGDVVVHARGSRLLLVNVIDLEEYLAAVLGAEMPRHFPDEALKAQAIAARTYALHKKLGAYDATYHLGSSVLHQVYGGVGAEDPRTRAAVEATHGQVLTFDLEPIEAYFHASCGGRTESGAAALVRDLPYLTPVECPCSTLPASRWASTLPLEELRQAFGDEVDRAEPVGRTPTGRVRRVRLTPSRSVDAVEFRRRLGYTRVKSLAFEVAPVPGGLSLSGRGNGHGAGLCQWGAKALADRGWSYREILEHYYPGAELQHLY